MMYKGNTAPGEPRSTDSNDWEGYCIDLLNEIGKELNFTYVINLVPDATYGNMKIVDGEEVWDGMVQELKTRRADLAVGSFTITYDRARVIDFTTPFMYLGISIIYKRIEDKRSHLFSFLQPLSAPVWGYILAATIMVSLILFVVARFSPYEWKINHPCNHSKFPTYKRMWQFMSSQKGLLMNTTPEAIRRVKREEYAYILESTMNEYYTQRDCQLMQIGGLLDSKGYGIGLPQG
ncbi:hypothetical protein AHF37_09985 [Paragonimus kellicotti]|nr:hypothetical protein AHF37_09985 [Paragonimus kellicotti]